MDAKKEEICDTLQYEEVEERKNSFYTRFMEVFIHLFLQYSSECNIRESNENPGRSML